MTLHTRLLLPLVVALALPLAGMSLCRADEASLPPTEAEPAAAEPAAVATEADCGCGARSPGQLLETQQEVNEAITAEPGS